MASPLNIFRKYQKHLMAGLLLTAMITFVIGPAIMQYFGDRGSGRGADKVAVSWKGGQLTESSSHILRENHNLLVNFLGAVVNKASESKGSPKATPISRATSEEELVLRLIKARKAEQMGLVVTEEAMIHYLRLLSDNTVPVERFNLVMNEATNSRLDERTMFQQLRMELLAQRFESLTFGDWREAINRVRFEGAQPFALPPSVAWDYFRRMHRRVQAEMVAMPAANFLGEVKQEPSAGEIQKLYDEYKDKLSDPYSPDPGFKKYNSVAFQYVKSDFSKFLNEEKAKVTQEQIIQYYEKNKATSYPALDLPELPLDKPSTDKPSDEKPPADKPSADKPSAEKPPTEKPSAEKPPAEKPADDIAPKPENCDDEPAKEPPVKIEPKEEDPKPLAKDDPAKTEVPPKKTGDPKSSLDDPEKPADDPEKPKKKETKYRPLDDKLQEEIRNLIAQPLASERRKKAVEEVQKKVQDYARAFKEWEAINKLDTKDKEPPPEPLDLKALARSVGFGWGETPLVDPIVMLEDAKREKPKYELSRTVFVDLRTYNQYDFAMYAFEAGAALYQLQMVYPKEMSGDVRYYFWRTQEKPGYVPKLEEVKREVVAAWKNREAFKLAREAAEKLADEVTKSKKSIKETLPGGEAARAFETDSFSWLSRNTPSGSPGQLGISRIKKAGPADEDAVDTAGEDFMEAVFSLKKGECGVAANHPQTEAYVVRIFEEPISEDLLLKMFLDVSSKTEIYILALQDRQRQLNDWEQQLQKEMAIKWRRDPWVSDRM